MIHYFYYKLNQFKYYEKLCKENNLRDLTFLINQCHTFWITHIHDLSQPQLEVLMSMNISIQQKSIYIACQTNNMDLLTLLIESYHKHYVVIMDHLARQHKYNYISIITSIKQSSVSECRTALHRMIPEMHIDMITYLIRNNILESFYALLDISVYDIRKFKRLSSYQKNVLVNHLYLRGHRDTVKDILLTTALDRTTIKQLSFNVGLIGDIEFSKFIVVQFHHYTLDIYKGGCKGGHTPIIRCYQGNDIHGIHGIMEAVSGGHRTNVEYLMNNCQTSISNFMIRSFMYEAIKQNDQTIFLYFYNKYEFDVQEVQTFLQVSCESGNEETFYFLIDDMRHRSIPIDYNDNLLVNTVKGESVSILREILYRTDITAFMTCKPIDYAVKQKLYKMSQILFEQASPSVRQSCVLYQKPTEHYDVIMYCKENGTPVLHVEFVQHEFKVLKHRLKRMIIQENIFKSVQDSRLTDYILSFLY